MSRFTLAGDTIPSTTVQLEKCLRKAFNASLEDGNCVKYATKDFKEWLTKAGLPGRFKAMVYEVLMTTVESKGFKSGSDHPCHPHPGC